MPSPNHGTCQENPTAGPKLFRSFGSTDLLGFGECRTNEFDGCQFAGIAAGHRKQLRTALLQWRRKGAVVVGLVPYPVRKTFPGASQLEKIFPLGAAPIPNSPLPCPTVVEVNPSSKIRRPEEIEPQTEVHGQVLGDLPVILRKRIPLIDNGGAVLAMVGFRRDVLPRAVGHIGGIVDPVRFELRLFTAPARKRFQIGGMGPVCLVIVGDIQQGRTPTETRYFPLLR